MLKMVSTAFMIVVSTSVYSQINQIGNTDLGAVTHSETFLQVMKMVGDWEGKLHQPDGTIVDTSTSFKLTSNGNTVVETLVEDGVEMITTYSDKDGELVVKHYCALGTEPMFTAASVDSTSLNLVSDPTPGYDASTENFVESMKWTLDSEKPSEYRVDSAINMDGEVITQYSLFQRVN
jgi:hypothetical protein